MKTRRSCDSCSREIPPRGSIQRPRTRKKSRTCKNNQIWFLIEISVWEIILKKRVIDVKANDVTWCKPRIQTPSSKLFEATRSPINSLLFAIPSLRLKLRSWRTSSASSLNRWSPMRGGVELGVGIAAFVVLKEDDWRKKEEGRNLFGAAPDRPVDLTPTGSQFITVFIKQDV